VASTSGRFHPHQIHQGFSEVAAVAQSVEQRIRNAKVTSSIPVSGTKSGKKGSQLAALFTSGRNAVDASAEECPRIASAAAIKSQLCSSAGHTRPPLFLADPDPTA
jgi:hypothetical protein